MQKLPFVFVVIWIVPLLLFLFPLCAASTNPSSTLGASVPTQQLRGNRSTPTTKDNPYERNGYSRAPREFQAARPPPRTQHDNASGHPFKCFESNEELRAAVKTYESYKKPNRELALKYGHPIGKWCVKGVADFSFVFQHKRNFNEPLSHWDTSMATSMAGMFQDCQQFNQDLSHFNTSNVEDMSNMFEAAIKFEGHGLEAWNTEAVTNMDFMFLHALAFKRDISHWQVQNVRSMKAILKDARSFSQEMHLDLLASWSFNNHVDMLQMSDYWIEGSVDEENNQQPIMIQNKHQSRLTPSSRLTPTTSSRLRAS